MREIKFRAWIPDNKYNKRMTKPFEIDDIRAVEEYNSTFASIGNQDNLYLHDIEKEYLMQYTGLKDKNGKEIYEGDIVKTYWVSNNWDGGLGVIEWKPKSACFKIVRGENFCGINNRPEVIGNIYENPELLEKKE